MKPLWAGLCLAGLVTAGVGSLHAQQKTNQPQPPAGEETEPLLKVDVNLVNVLFSVRDKKGALIPGLTKEDFSIFEEGKQQTIKTFVRETDLPLTLGLLVDVSRSQENLIGIERQAASHFFSRVLRPKDMAFLISFGADAELLQDSTNSVRLLSDALRELRLSVSTSGMGPMPSPVPTQGRGTILFDAISLAATEKLRGEVGRKAIVVITDGVDQGSRYTLQRAVDDAHRADAIIYAIEYVDPHFYGFGFGGGGAGVLKKMAEETGGRMFRVDRKMSLDQIFDEIQNEMRSQYALAYTPASERRNGEFRKIEIRPANKDLKVQARKGYFASGN